MSDDTLPLASEPPVETGDPQPPRPRTRWAGIVWGLAFGAIAAGGIWLSSGLERLDGLSAWLLDLGTGAAIGYGLLTVGGLLLVGGIAGLLRRAQLAASRR
ncbi:MAG: hypothetical protein P0Y48_00090 [Candidatus Microbacterium phytovorans]|uniref:Uncharacterized protein n=1 Tax=Candidatus Microbacterium phytovorans TaxID=3121374 RepID=A0AAJ5W139_9MICO|nr:hypothetical protein [Microbacterium sp.]WEK13645.1 MAG: hypothetical protein P0Y48_00090 [Microbacterium sp.]